MIKFLLPLLKYWRAGGVILLSAAFLLTLHLAKSRGEKIDALRLERQALEKEIINIKKAKQDEKNRNEFRKKQNGALRVADDNAVRDVYERLRERQISHIGK